MPSSRRSRLARIVPLVLVIAGVGGLFAALRPHPHHPPFFPQFRRHVAGKLHASVLFATRSDPRGRDLVVTPPPIPKADVLPSVAAYGSAVAAGIANPGAASLRADTDLFCTYNYKEVEDKARKEGITTGEVVELTFFGFSAMRVSQPEAVQRVLGRNLTPDEVKKLDDIVQQENESFTAALHQAVDRGATLQERLQLIQAYEQYFMDRFTQGFGMTPAQYDDMLAPDPVAPPGPKVALPAHVQPPPPEDPRGEPPPPDPNVRPKPVAAPLQPPGAKPSPAPPPPPGAH